MLFSRSFGYNGTPLQGHAFRPLYALHWSLYQQKNPSFLCPINLIDKIKTVSNYGHAWSKSLQDGYFYPQTVFFIRNPYLTKNEETLCFFSPCRHTVDDGIMYKEMSLLPIWWQRWRVYARGARWKRQVMRRYGRGRLRAGILTVREDSILVFHVNFQRYFSTLIFFQR